MRDDQRPQCVIRMAPNTISVPIDITFVKVSETENLLDNQEELISTPLKVNFDSPVNSPSLPKYRLVPITLLCTIE